MFPNVCECCGGSGDCAECDGRKVVMKTLDEEDQAAVVWIPCGACFGTGKCMACQPLDEPADLGQES